LAWMAERKAELLGVPYFHVVFTLLVRIGAIAFQNKGRHLLLFKASSQTISCSRLAHDWADEHPPLTCQASAPFVSHLL
jgi:hypothetical protein